MEVPDLGDIPVLVDLRVDSRPLTTHALAWSGDAELAVAADDSIHIYFPEFPASEGFESQSQASDTVQQQYFSSITRFLTTVPDPAINRHLENVPHKKHHSDERGFPGVGVEIVGGNASSLNQVMAMEWSPTDLGHNKRPVLAVLTTAGSLILYGEQVDNTPQLRISPRARNASVWKALWGMGANLPLSDSYIKDKLVRPGDRIRSFAWAKRLGPGIALLAFTSDAEDVVIISVRHYSPSGAALSASNGDFVWEVREVGRFSGAGPHPQKHFLDPDYVPKASAFSVRWSPWYHAAPDAPMVATLAYTSNNYVGFRRVSVHVSEAEQKLVGDVGETDHFGICTALGADAFLEFESSIWTIHDEKICRGVLATPFRALPFRLPIVGDAAPLGPHSLDDCNTICPIEEEEPTNPITGIIIHPPNVTRWTPAPTYTLVRASATAGNTDWHQSNALLAESAAEVEEFPQWTEKISRMINLLIPESMAIEGIGSDAGSSTDEDDQGLPEEAGNQVHPYRVRIWGLAASPGGGSTAVLISKHSTVHPSRACRTQVMFGWSLPKDTPDAVMDGRLSTEAQVWERMYGGGPPVPGVGSIESGGANLARSEESERLHEHFEGAASKQTCAYCEGLLRRDGDRAVCDNGHVFGTCAVSGLAILGPYLSRACGVCGLKCLFASEMKRIAGELLGPDLEEVEISAEVCSGCGGKFMV